LSNPVPWQNWMVAYLGYTLRMRTLFRGWPIMVNDTHTRRRRLSSKDTLQTSLEIWKVGRSPTEIEMLKTKEITFHKPNHGPNLHKQPLLDIEQVSQCPSVCLFVCLDTPSWKSIGRHFFCRGWSDLDKISQTGTEWHVDCGDVCSDILVLEFDLVTVFIQF